MLLRLSNEPDHLTVTIKNIYTTENENNQYFINCHKIETNKIWLNHLINKHSKEKNNIDGIYSFNVKKIEYTLLRFLLHLN